MKLIFSGWNVEPKLARETNRLEILSFTMAAAPVLRHQPQESLSPDIDHDPAGQSRCGQRVDGRHEAL